MTTAQMPQIEQPATRQWSRSALLAQWVCGGMVLLAFLGASAVSRTQEARVLETARQMLGQSVSAWLTPHINGDLRLAKPPLCYWMTAAAYNIAGHVNETIGRIPSAIIGWLTLGVTFAFARRLFDQRVALASSCAMLGSMLFFKHMRLAETDAPATLFVTLAVYAIWRSATGSENSYWLHLAAASTGFAAVSKGGPAAFPILFLIAYAFIERRLDLLRRFITSGAIVTLVVIAASWFIFIIATEGARVFLFEARTAARGRDHFAWPTTYIPSLLIGAAPWTGVLPLALLDSIREWKLDPRHRMLLIWSASILVPLCLIGNKQTHYLLPLIPPIMIMIGHVLIACPKYLIGWLKLVLGATYVIAIIGVLDVPVIGPRLRGHFMPIDAIAALAMLIVLLIPMFAVRRSWPQTITALLYVTPVVLLIALGVWLPTTQTVTTRTVAREIHDHFGDGPYLFSGTNLSLPLCFNMRHAIPLCETTEELLQRATPGAIAIAQTKNNTTPPPLPHQFVYVLSVAGTEDQKFDLYRYEPSSAGAPAATSPSTLRE